MEKQLLTTEKVTTSDEVHKRTDKVTTSEEVLKVLIRFTKVLRILQQMRRLKKVLKNCKIQKMKWLQYVGRIQKSLRVSIKDI